MALLAAFGSPYHKRERIGNQIDTAAIFPRSNLVSVQREVISTRELRPQPCSQNASRVHPRTTTIRKRRSPSWYDSLFRAFPKPFRNLGRTSRSTLFRVQRHPLCVETMQCAQASSISDQLDQLPLFLLVCCKR